MVINVVSVQYNGGLLPSIILLTLCDTTLRNPFNNMKKCCPYNQCSNLNLLTCLEGLDEIRFFFKRLLLHTLRNNTMKKLCNCSL